MCYDEQAAAPRTAVCEICGATFTPRGAQKYTCSPACSQVRERARNAAHRCENLVHVQISCVICGEPFDTTTTSGRKTCSTRCSRILKDREAIASHYTLRTCPVCGQEYRCTKRRREPMCPRCQKRASEDRQAAAAAAKRKNHSAKTGICVICGATFKQIRTGTKKTCSPECSRKLAIRHIKRYKARARAARAAHRMQERALGLTVRRTTAKREPKKTVPPAQVTAATPSRPRKLTMAQRARLLRQAIAKSAFQQRARAEMEFLAEQEKKNEIDFKNNLNSSAAWW